ncbi:3891_t:CDS:2 [Diversispora eburnea]|uniref:3891_t:CDS:1 n=1 Tax=Diversispora eburnea TaxID=1213867 RepID=A0A9N8W8K5_9GLOM|nr:3891_t:CDS:2 [Diversispora eburnea]
MTETKPPTSNSNEEVLQFLETLDTYSQTTQTTNPAPATSGGTSADTQSVLDFLDQITQSNTTEPNTKSEIQVNNNGSLKQEPYKTASNVVDTSVNRALATVETVRTNEATKKLEERVRGIVTKETIEKLDLRTLGLNTLTTVVNAVVPPISQYEIVEVWLAHDMVGYVGVESLVYKAFMRVMEQVEGGDIIVRKGNESRKRDSDYEFHNKDLNVCEGFTEAVGLAKKNYKPYNLQEESFQIELHSQEIVKDSPTTVCPIFMAIQPTKANPSLPVSWLDVPYEENEWVEAKMVSTIKLAVQTIAQDYVWHRMTAVGF